MALKQRSVSIYLLLICINLFFSAPGFTQMSQPQIDSMATELGKAKDDTNKVNLLMNLGNEVGYTDLKKALDYAQQGYTLSIKINFDKGMGRTSYLTGISHLEMGNYLLADSFLNISEKKFLQLNDKKNLAKIANARGSRHLMVGNYVLAADFLSKAAEGFDTLRDTALSMIAYQNLIAVLGQVKNHERAVMLGKKNLSLAVARNDSLQIGYTLQGLVTDLVNLKKYDEAQSYIDPLRIIANTTADQNLAAESHSTIGTFFYKKMDFTRASEHFEISIQKALTLSNAYQLANHYNSLGQSQYRDGMFLKAGESLHKALALAQQNNNKGTESDVALSLSSLYDSMGNYENAYKSLLLHTQLTDSILSGETRNYSSQLEALYETNKKENEILRLQKVEQEQDFEIKRRNTYLGIGLGMIAALIIILYLIRRNHRNRQKLSEQQSILLVEKIKTIEKEQQITSLQSMINGQETERTRIARDLHDGLGGIFSTVKMHYSTLQQATPAIRENPLYKKTLELINNAADELRKVAHNMMPEVLMKVGLVEALRDFCNNISSGKLLKISLQTFDTDTRLGSSAEVMLYRIIQELVNNIIKHAYASEAIIQINREGNRLSLIIEDNGRGFDTREVEQMRSMGIATVKSRVDYLNGKLTIDSRKNIGTTVMIDLLINEN